MLYPNPATEKVFILLPEVKTQSVAEIWSINGQLLSQQTLPASDTAAVNIACRASSGRYVCVKNLFGERLFYQKTTSGQVISHGRKLSAVNQVAYFKAQVTADQPVVSLTVRINSDISFLLTPPSSAFHYSSSGSFYIYVAETQAGIKIKDYAFFY
jgi:hypothetical protein